MCEIGSRAGVSPDIWSVWTPTRSPVTRYLISQACWFIFDIFFFYPKSTFLNNCLKWFCGPRVKCCVTCWCSLLVGYSRVNGHSVRVLSYHLSAALVCFLRKTLWVTSQQWTWKWYHSWIRNTKLCPVVWCFPGLESRSNIAYASLGVFWKCRLHGSLP